MTLLHIVDSVESPSGSTGAPCGLLTPSLEQAAFFHRPTCTTGSVLV